MHKFKKEGEKKVPKNMGKMRKLNNIKDGQLMNLSMTKVGKLDNP